MTRKREDVRLALDTTLSGVSRDPTLFNRIVNASKGDAPPVKRKLTLSMAFVLVLALITGSVAIAAAYRGVSYFLTEKTCSPISIDHDYLISGLSQSHTSAHINVTVTDAYWDGVDLSFACHVSPVDPDQLIRIDDYWPEHEHYRPIEDADILLHYPDLRNMMITDDESGVITRPHHYASNWVYEDDDSLTLFISFPLNSMEKPATVSIPFSLTLTATGEQFDSVLHCQLPALADPVTAHEHVWKPATCTSPKTCAICRRSEGTLGPHDFQSSEDFDEYSVCTRCGYVKNWSHGIPSGVTLHPGDTSDYVFVLHMHLRELGFLDVPFSNTYDDATVEAVKAFQESQGLLTDGVCGLATMEKLFP